MPKYLFNIAFFILISLHSYAQLNANAGPNKLACYNSSVTIGGSPTASGGTPPYTYKWQPSLFLNSTTVANPVASNCTSFVQYTLTVMDKDSVTDVSTMYITIDNIYTFSAGPDTGYCYTQEAGVKIGIYENIYANAWQTFSWSPTTGLDNPSSINPFASPSVTTTYTLTVSDGQCPNNVSQVTVSAFTPPYTDASPDTTIDEGQTITLYGTGGTVYWWQPDYNIKYQNTANADVWPIVSTTYTLYTNDQHGCYANDVVRVTVEKGDKLFFYSAFTPNRDGENDFFYIGNVEKYPDNNLKIYNRYGKQIFSATNYLNTWDGTYLGVEVPTGTYFYIFDDGIDQKYRGTVTIMR